MSRIFISGSSDGLGSLAAKALVKNNHQVYLHARNAQRAKDAEKACPGAAGVLIADLSSTEQTKQLANELNEKGPWDSIIMNAGVMRVSSTQQGPEGHATLFATNVLAPYMLTCLVQPPPKHLVFLSSQLHQSGDSSLRNLTSCGYSDSKLYNTMLAFFFARKWPNVQVNSLDPGWVATKMGGAGASGSAEAATQSYVMLAEGSGPAKGKSGRHWYHNGEKNFQEAAADESLQENLVQELEKISGISVPSQTSTNL